MLRTKFLFAVAAMVAAGPITSAYADRVAERAPDTTGWTLLGQQEVAGKRDRDTIVVGKYEGKFDQLQVVVLDSDIDLKDLTVVFANGEKWSPALKHSFREGQRTKAIDLPGNNRAIAKIELLYANTPGGGRAKVAVYARDKAANNAPKPAVWDSRGWSLLGSQEVAGRRDRDTIVVGKYEGKFDQLQLVVLDSDIELKDLTVFFANGEKWSPGLKASFKEGQRTRAIDLPGQNRTIHRIELAYANTPGGGKAKVEVWGRDTGKKPAPAPVAFDSKGWTLLGTQAVKGRRDKDTIKVGRYAGAFDQLTMVVTDSDLELRGFKVSFAGGGQWSPPNLQHAFKEGARTRVIDLPGKDRTITRIDLNYGNTPGGGDAKVELYGRDAGRPAPPEIKPVVWENKGWTLLGKSTVDGWRDRDRLDVRQPNPFTEVMFVVSGSDVLLNNIVITLGNGEKFEMKQQIAFKEGTRTAPVDIPGKLRKIKSIDFAYANLPGGGRASVEVWARTKAVAPQPQPPLPPNGNPGPMPPPTTKPPATQPTPPPAPTQAPPPPPVVRDHR